MYLVSGVKVLIYPLRAFNVIFLPLSSRTCLKFYCSMFLVFCIEVTLRVL
jgi:hypothetical protein